MDMNGRLDRSLSMSDHSAAQWEQEEQCWENEDSSDSAFNLGLGLIDQASDYHHDHHGLGDDKDVAARAVAFVVNSTRKGIVPLCADVASLLQNKKTLESKISLLRSENSSLRSRHTSCVHSESPTCNSLQSYSDHAGVTDNHLSTGPSSPACSHCSSSCSSLVNSPKLKNSTSHRHHRHDRNASAFRLLGCSQEDSFRLVTETAVHQTQCDPNSVSDHSLRKKSLPEIISVPHEDVPKISPQAKMISTEVQCCLMSDPSQNHLEEQLDETQKTNTNLARELGTAKKEINFLKSRLQELEMFQLARRFTDKFRIESEIDKPLPCWCETTPDVNKCSSPENNSSHMCNFSTADTNPVMLSSPLYQCLCEACKSTTQYYNAQEVHYTSEKATGVYARLGDHIVLHGDRTGVVRYVGHLDRMGQSNLVYLGVHLDARVGKHDGTLNGKRFFKCDSNCGIFIPAHEVVAVIGHQNLSVDR